MVSIEEVSRKTFDYVIVGGGAAGLTVAGRLAEDVEISVLVLEAGPMNLNDPRISNPGTRSQVLGKPEYDWAFMTVPQKDANGRRVFWPRGRTLGGTSAINAFIWDKPSSCEIDAWEKLGNPGWNWDTYLKYSQKTEGFAPKEQDGPDDWISFYKSASLGETGPLGLSFPRTMFDGDKLFQNTLQTMGVDVAKDVLGGDPIGRTVNPLSIDGKSHLRSYSVSAFYVPNEDKPNFNVLCGALVHKLVLEKSGDEFVAEAVEFEYGGSVYQVHAKKEIVLSAGVLKTPQILELSGVGDSSFLNNLGIEMKVDLPGVGTMVQDHIFANVCWEIDPKEPFETIDRLRDPEFATEQMDLNAQGKGMSNISMSSTASLPLKAVVSEATYQELLSKQRKRLDERAAALSPGLKKQYNIQMSILSGNSSADCEFVSYPGYFPPQALPAADVGKKYTTVGVVYGHPFSRGTVHITSSNPTAQPAIDPHYLEEDIDLQILLETLKYTRTMADYEPFKQMIKKEVIPGPQYTSDEELKTFIRNTVSTTFHTIGGACMSPRKQDGVVDDKLKVYGLRNVRVADLSVVPLHFGAHSQATAYAIAERAADLIKGRIV